MIQTITKNGFRDAFNNMDRKNQFSYEGLGALYDWLEMFDLAHPKYADDTGQQTELDVISICCDFTEYGNLEELQKDYSDIESLEDLQNETTVIMIDDESFIIQQY